MRKLKFYLLLLAVASIAFAGCKKSDSAYVPVDYTVNLVGNYGSLTWSGYASSGTIVITKGSLEANGDCKNIKITINATPSKYFYATVASGKYTFTITGGDSNDSGTGALTGQNLSINYTNTTSTSSYTAIKN